MGSPVAHHPAAEADHAAAAVVDGEHHPVAEAVVALAAVAVDHEAGGVQLRRVVFGKHRLEALPGVGRIADAETRGDFAGEAAALEVVDGARRVLQLRAVELGRGEQDFVQVLRFVALFALARALDARHFHAGIAREFLDGVGKRLAAVFHQEADGRAVRAAAEAVVELLARADRERRRLLAVERAAGHVVRAGLLQRHVAVDHLDDVHPRQQRLDEVGRDH